MARAALGYGGRILWEVSRDDDQLVPLLERALAAQGAGDDPLRIRLMCRLAGGPLRDASFPPQRRADLSEAALDAARRLGEPETLAYALHGYILGHHSPAHTPTQLALADELIDVATEAGDKERVYDGREERLVSLIELGQMDAARLELESMARLAAELRQPSHLWMVRGYRALVALLDGRLAEAEELIREARALGERAQSWNAVVTHRLQLYVLRREQGRLGEMQELVRSSVEEYPTYPIFRCALAVLCEELGETIECRNVFEAIVKDGRVALPVDEEWLVGTCWLAETAVALSDLQGAAVIYELLLPYAARVAISYPEVSAGPVARYLGIVAAALGNLQEARPHFEAAIEISARIGARGWLAHSHDDYARALLAAGERAQALELIGEAVTVYRALGMKSWAENAAELGRTAESRQ